MISYSDKLRSKLKEGKVVPVVGAGVSYATAGLPGWFGLISAGFDYAEQFKADVTRLKYGRQLLDEGKLIESASVVKELLNAPGRPFVNWLQDTLGEPKVKTEQLIESIQNLCQPIIATTNYDDLLRKVGVSETNLALDWKEHEDIKRCIDFSTPFILHLHGIYYRPDTAIFSLEDYEKLSQQKGYRHLLQSLWMDRTFMFIGCSRDGVMDEDFSILLKVMRDWFPNDQREHYLLVKDGDVGTEAHHELMRECNVHMVAYGPNHDSLPHYLNSINPNADKIKKRLEERTANALKAITAILGAQPDDVHEKGVEEFVKGHLGSPHYWLDNDQLKVFNAALKAYNLTVADRQQKFRNQQLAARAIVNVARLNSNIDLWHHNWRDTSQVNNLEFINTGIFAFEALQTFSPDILEDINLRHPRALRPTYFNGYLASFYNEAKNWKRRSGDLAEFDGDSYFFENLRRIMDCLKEVLLLDPSEVYGEKEVAQISKTLPQEQVLMVSDSFISIHQASSPFPVIARLPWLDRLNFEDAQLVYLKGERLVVGCNAKSAFYWNPCKDLDATPFYQAEKEERIWQIEVIEEGRDIMLELYTNMRRVTVANFSAVVKSRLDKGYAYYTRIEKSGKTYCVTSSTPGLTANCVFEYQSGEYVPVLTTENVRNFIEDLRKINLGFKTTEDSSNDFRLDFQDITLNSTQWVGGQCLVVRCRIGHPVGPDSTALLFFDPSSDFEHPILKIYFPHKNCFSFDTNYSNGKVNLVVGYLDFNKVGNLIQFFEDIESVNLIIANDQPGAVPQELIRTKTRDMFNTVYIDETRALVLEEGKKVHEVALPELSDIETALEKRIHKLTFSNR